MSYKVALIGAGVITASHLEAICQMEELHAVGIADVNKERAEQAAMEHKTNAYTDYKEMIQREKPDIAVIALPHFLHKEAAVWCANAGCHLMLEKPMALNTSDCDEIIAAAERNGIRLMVGHTIHYIAENRKAKEIVRSGALGELVMINDARHVNYYRPDRPDWFFWKEKAGGGIMMNLGSHSIDKIQWLTGSTVRSVKASISCYGNKGNIEGSGTVFLETSEGVPATISQSGYGGVNKNVTELIFTKGMLKLCTGQGLWISERGEFKEVAVNDHTHPFVLQFQDLLRSMEQGTELECSGAYGRSVIHVVESIYRSHQERKEIIIV